MNKKSFPLPKNIKNVKPPAPTTTKTSFSKNFITTSGNPMSQAFGLPFGTKNPNKGKKSK